MGAYRQMEESRNKTNQILMGAIGQGNTENNFYMNNGKITQGSYNVQGGNQQMYMSVGPQLVKGSNQGVL